MGTLWISELDTTSALQNVPYVAIGHANATEDWVIWEDGTGNITVDWEIDMEVIHPEYYVKFALSVYNVDDNNTEIGNDTFIKTYTADLGYDESDTLTVALEFTQQQQQVGCQTLVCYLDAQVILNDTVEAVNFTSWGQDRCVVAVDFTTPDREPPFSRYTQKVNDEFPSMWSYIDGWAVSERFGDEDDMLNNQTFFNVGTGTLNSTSTSGDLWDLGDADIWRDNNLMPHVDYSVDYDEFTIDPDEGKLITKVKVDYEVLTKGIRPNVALMRFQLKKEGGELAHDFFLKAWNIWTDGPTGILETTITAHTTDDTWPPGGDGKVRVWGDFKVAVFAGGVSEPMKDEQHPLIYIIIGNGQGDSVDIEHNYCNWEESCAYQNESYEVAVDSSTASGITTVEADITDILQLQSTGEFVYTFAGDRGDTRIELTC